MGRADRARRERQSRRLSFRSRRPAGPATPSSPSFVRRLPRAAAGLLLVFAALFAASTAAHAQTTLVSNFNQGNDSNAGFTRGVAQPFTTGLNSGGYTLNSVEFEIEALVNQAAFSVSVCGADTNGHPTSTCEDLTFSRSTAAGRYFYDAPAGTALSAGTSYTVVFTTTNGTVTYDVTRSDDEDSGGAAGWTLEDEYRFLNSSFEWVSTSNKALRVTIKGTVNRGTDATLSDLTLSKGTLSPGFAADEFTYTASVGDTASRITVTPTKTDTNATVEFLDGNDAALTDAAGAAGFQVNLDVGDNVIRVKVTAEDGIATETYQVTVERAQYVCAAPDLSGRTAVWSATMTVGFDEDNDTLGYDSSNGALSEKAFEYRGISNIVRHLNYRHLSNLVSLFTDTAFPVSERANLRLHVCSDSFGIAATNDLGDGNYQWQRNLSWSTGISVSVALSAEPSSDAGLSGLKLEESAGPAIPLNPPFAFSLTDYMASVANSVSRVTVTPVARSAYATLRYLDGAGNALADLDTLAAGHQVDLVEGANTIQVEVTAEDGATTRTYTVALTRAAQADTDATLSALELSDGTLSPLFAPDVTAYTASVPNAVERITVTAVKSDSAATVEFLDGAGDALPDLDLAATGHQVGLVEGANTIQVAVTAGEGTTTTIYTVTVTRAAQSNTDATLSGLVLERLDGTPIALSRSFDSDRSNYGAVVPTSVFEMRLTPTVTDPAATIQWRYDYEVDEEFLPVANGDRVQVFVTDNAIVLKVTAGDGTTTKTYTVTVRARGNEFFCEFPDLSGRSEVWSGTLTVGGSGNFGYSSPNISDYGALSDSSFEYRGNSYTVEELFEYGDTTPDWVLIRLDGTFPNSDRDRLRLHLCGDTLAFGLALQTGSHGSYTYVWSDAHLDWSNATTVLAMLSADNVAPEFEDGATAMRSVAENAAAGTGFDTPVSAADEETLVYSLEGTDAASFDIDPGTGQLKARAGESYDHETKSTYDVIVKADDGIGLTATIAVTVNVVDVDEPPGAPAEPLVKAAGATSLSAMWTEPSNTGPAIDGYDLRYKVEGAAGWTDGPQNLTATTGSVTGLAEDTTYKVQVRATNAEGDGEWSARGTGNTGSAASGKPEISGVAQVGEVLTAGKGTVTDLNGTTTADSGDAYEYQWILVDGGTETDIAVATSKTYTPAASDVGKSIKVKLSFTDDADMDETVTSDPVGPVGAALGTCPAVYDWCAELTVGADGAPPDASYGYRNSGPGYGSLDDDGIEYGGMFYTVETLTVADAMVTVETAGARVPHDSVFTLGGTEFTADAGSEHATGGYRWAAPANFAWLDGQKVTVSVKLGNFAATGRPGITGIARNGETLTAGKGTVADPDGTTKADRGAPGFAFVYSWQPIDGETGEPLLSDEDIEFGSTYTLSAANVGNKVRLITTFFDDKRNDEIRYGNAYPATYAGILDVEPEPVPEPGPCPAVYDWCTTLTVGVEEGGTEGVASHGYSSSYGHLEGGDSIDIGTLSWTIEVIRVVTVDGFAGGVELIIRGDEEVPYGSVLNLGGTEFTIDADSIDEPGEHDWMQPAGFEWVEGQRITVSVRLANFAATGNPEITGTAQVGEALTATTSGIVDADGKTNADNGDAGYAYTYQWILVDGTTQTDIAGETSNTYTPTPSDAGKKVKVRVSFTDDRDYNEMLTSDAYPAGSATILPLNNREATGKPGITGGAQVGKTLTATTSDIMDADGKTNADNGDTGYAYTYQWILVDGTTETDIAGATSKTYTLTASNADRKIKVRVSFTDDLGYTEEPPTSDATAAVFAACDAGVVWCARLTAFSLPGGSYGCVETVADRHCGITSVLTEDRFTLVLTHVVERVERRSDGQLRFHLGADLTTATESLVLVVDDDKRFPFAHANGKGGNHRHWNNSGLSWQNGTVVDLKLVEGSTVATLVSLDLEDGDGAAVGLSPGFAADQLTYTAEVDNAVDAITILAEPSDSGARIEYLDESDSAIADDDTNTEGHQVSIGDGDNTIKVQVTAEDGVAIRTYTLTVAREDSEDGNATGQPTISGTAQVGLELTASTSGIVDTDGKTKADNGDAGYAYTYRWIRVNGATQTNIVGESSNTYTPTPSDEGKKVKVRVSFTDDLDNSETLTSDAYPAGSAVITPNDNTPATGRPRITGTAQEGKMLSADKNNIADDDGTTNADNGDAGYVYTYQWIVVDGTTETDIAGETSNNYTPSDSDVGKKVKVRVSFTDDRDYSEMLTSNAYPAGSAVITLNDNTPATGRPRITGTAQEGEMLSANKGNIADDDGTTKADNGDAGYAYTYQWIVVDGTTETDIAGETSNTYTPVASDAGKKIKVRVSFTDDQDSVEMRTSVATAIVAGICDEVWCAWLTVKYLFDPGRYGCANSSFADRRCSNTSVLTENEFTHISTPYTVTKVERRSNGQLQFWLAETLTTASESLVLVVGNRRFPFAHANGKQANNRRWNNSGLNWQEQEEAIVGLKLVEGSTVATLVSLDLEDGDGAAVGLSPGFAADQLTYTAEVDDATVEITILAEPSDTGARIEYLDESDSEIADDDTNTEGRQVSLAVGNNTIKVQVTAEDGVTIRTYTLTVAREDSEDGNATGQPTISGTAQVGLELTASTSDIMDVDGKTKAENGDSGYAYTYQWVRVDGADEADIAGATSNTYTPVPADEGNSIKVSVEFTDDLDNDEGPLTSDATGPVSAANNAPTVANAIPDQVATAGTEFSHTFPANTFSDADDDPLSYTATQSDETALPAWLTFVDDTRTFSGTPADADIGTVTVKVTASDGSPGGTVIDMFDIVVASLPVLTLTADPASIAEEDDDTTTGVTENVSILTVEITNDETFVEDRTVTLTFSGDATEGTHYSVSPADADSTAAGHQVVLLAGESSVEVTVTATGNDTADGNRAVTVAADLDGTAIGRRDITIRDDEATTPALVFSESSLEMAEEGSTQYSVTLATQPSANVTVTITGQLGTDLTLDETSLTFTTSNWNMGQTVRVTADQDDDATHDSATLTHTASGGGYGAVFAELPVTVSDNTEMGLEAVIKTVTEGESMPIRARLPMPLDDDVTITVTVARILGDDEYELSTNTMLTIAAGDTESTGDVVFTSLDDFANTGVGIFNATLTPDHPRVDGDTESIIVYDDDLTRSVLQVAPPKIFENGGTATLRGIKLRLHEGVVKMEVSLEPSGRATLSGNTLTFPPGALYATETLTITAVDNTSDEADHAITVSAMVTEGRGIQTPAPVQLTIVDDDEMSPEVALVLTPPRVREGLVSTVTAVTSAPLDSEATITVSASPGHADTRTDDYALSADSVLTIPEGGTTSTGTVTIATVDDQLSGGGRRREVTVSGTVTGGGATNPDNQQLVVLEDDQQIKVALIATPATLAEGEVGTMTLRSLGGALPAAVTVTVDTGSNALELSADPVLMIAEGEVESTGTVTVTAVQDANTISEVGSMRGVPDKPFVQVDRVYIFIIDDDATDAELSLSPVPADLYEGETSTLIAVLNRPLSNDVTVTIAIDEADFINHTATADDFTLSGSLELTIPEGEMRVEGPTLTASNDEYYGPDILRTVAWKVVSVSGIDRNSVIKDSNWNILEDEEQPRVTLAVTPGSVAENNGQSTVTASLNTIVKSDLEVTVTTEPAVAAEPDDFTQTGSLLTIPADSKTGTGTVTISAVDDDIDGPDKHLVVRGTVEVVGMEQSGLAWFPYDESLTIQDDDTNNAPTVLNEIPDQSATPGTEFSYQFPANTFSDTDGDTLTYMATKDDGNPLPLWLIFADDTRTFSGTPADADIGTVTVKVTASDGSPGGTVIDMFDIVVASLPVLSFAETRVDVNETDGTAELTVNLVPESTGQVTVDYATSDRGAKAGEDYTAQSGTLNFAPGETSKTITIQITDDDIHELDVEIFDVDLTDPSGATVAEAGAGGAAQIYITSNDSEPVASMDDVTVGEGAGTMTLTLQLSHPSSKAVSYSVNSSTGGTATVSDDYADFEGSPSFGVITVPAGDRSAEFDITIIDDNVAESNETITIVWELGSNSPATPPSLNFTGTITDEDDLPALSLSVDPPSIAEEDDDTTTGVTENVSIVTVAITNGKTFAEEQTVTLTFSGGTLGTHYSVSPADADTNTANHQVVLLAGDSSVDVTVTATGNDTADGNRTVTVVGDLDGTAIDMKDITILDDDTTTTAPVPVTIVAQYDSIGGGLEDLVFTLTRTGDTTEPLTATVTITQDQTWLGNSDLSHTVIFPAGDATAPLNIVATKLSFSPTASGNLTATVSGDGISGGSDTVQVVSTADPPIAVGYDMDNYTFEEDTTDEEVYLVATLDAAYPRAPSRVFGTEAGVAVSTESGTARFRDDFEPITRVVHFSANDFEFVDGQYVARIRIADFDILDDMVYEVSEQFLLKVESGANLNSDMVRKQKPDGTVNGTYDVIITDDEDLPVLSLSVAPPSIAEEDDDTTTGVTENVSTVTVAITNGKTFVGEETVTLTFAGTATLGTHYSVSPADTDTNAAGHQVVLPAETASVQVTVTATANDMAHGNLTVIVHGDYDGLTIGTRDITIVDDDTTTTNNPATGAPVIMGTARVGETLTADTVDIEDEDGKPSRLNYQWVRLDGSSTPTDVGENSSTYTVQPADVDSTIRVDVTFTDDLGNLEGPLMSAAVGPVVALLPELSFAETRVDVDETDGSVALTVNLDSASTGQVTVDYATSDGASGVYGAKAAEDYTAKSDTLTFAPDETSKTITIQIMDDDIYEEVEIFVVDLANPSGATESATAGRTEVHITSEDSVPVASIDDVTVDEGAGTMRLTLRLSHPSTRAILYATSSADVGGTATVSEDYTRFLNPPPNNTFIEVAAGERTKDFDIAIIDDGAAESDETITIKWTKGASDEATPGVLNFTGAITDDDSANTAPVVLNAIPNQSATVGTQFSYTFPANTFYDADGDTLTYRHAYTTDSPDATTWLSFNSASRGFVGEPTDADVGTVTVTVTASDGSNETVSDEFDIVVASETCVLGGDVWCATLTVQNLSGGRGCANSQSGKACSNPSHLTEDEFTHDMTSYTVTSVQVRTNGELRFSLLPNLTTETRSLVLVVGSERFSFQRANVFLDNYLQWNSSGLSWSTGETVELRLVEGFPPRAPAAPGVNGVDNSDTSLKVTWSAPDNAGRPPITHYDLRYRVVGTGSGGWEDGPQDQTGMNAMIAGLTTGTEYDVRVRASNADGDGPWSPSGQGTPGVVETVETPPNGSLRLVVDNDEPDSTVGAGTGTGRLEVYFKRRGENGWGTVCDDRFTRAFDDPNDLLVPDDDNDAKVPNVAAEFACQLMGKETGRWISRPSDIPIARNKPIWLDDVRCAGTVGDDGVLEMANHWRTNPAEKLNHCYHAGVGLENCNHSEDVHLQCTGELEPESVAQEEEAAPLTGQVEDTPATHDGETPFTFRLVLSEDIANGDADMRDSAFEVSGGSVTGASRVDGRSDLWEITVTPDGTGNITLVLAANRECGTAGALCTADGRMLTTAWLGSVTAQPGTGTGTTATDEEGAAALTAQFAGMPAEHDGESKFRFRLVFSDEIFDGTEPLNKNEAMRDALAVTGGVATGSRRVDKTEFDEYWIWVKPSGNGPVTISLSPAASCGTSSVTCTPDGRKLTTPISARVEGPPGLSVADAEVQEGPGAALEFAVTLDRPTAAAVQVDYATRDGSAQAGSDYTASSGTLNFAAGETVKTVTVAVLDDSHDEGSETLTLVLSNPTGAYLADGEATGTIENSDLMPQAWLARFGRTVAEQVLDAVEERIHSAPQAGVQVTMAGHRFGGEATEAEALEEAEAKARMEDFSTWLAGEACRDDLGAGGDCPARSRAVAPLELLTGSSFALTTGAEGIGGGLVSLWGRGAVSRFDGREGDLSLSGEVTGALLGADWTRERWTTGLMLSHARGEGSYRGADSPGSGSPGSASGAGGTGGEVSSTVTGLYPYGRYALTDRVTVWGAAGYGAGTLTLTPEDDESTYEADMDLVMAAAGLRGTVVEAPADGGPELAVKTDALAVRTSSEATGGSAGGNLAAAEADVTRLRLGLEGTWRGLKIGTGTLAPRLEIGLRHDSGDAETGFGLDLGGGLAWSDPGTGIRAEVSARGLLTHENSGFRERGIAGSFGWDPTPGSDRGPSLTLSQTMGVSARGGADALLGHRHLGGLGANDNDPNGDDLANRRLELKLGYGFGAFGDRFTSTPEIGFGMSESHRDYSLVWRLVRDRRSGDLGSLEFSLEARRRESANDPGSGSGAGAEPEYWVGFSLTARF